MAHGADKILKLMIAELFVANAQLQAQVEQLQEQVAALTPPPKKDDP